MHASGGHSGPPGVPEPTYAERARTLLSITSVGMLSTVSRRRPGFPFGSVMPYALDAHGRPVFLISSMAMHTQNIQGDARASLLVAEEARGGDPLGRARATAVGEVRRIESGDVATVRSLYLERHENARHWVDYEDFAFYRMDVLDLYYVGGFGVMGWVAAEEYASAEPDPLAEYAAEIISHMNRDHADALLVLARHFGGAAEAEQASMTAVDRLGFHVRLSNADRVWGARIGFSRTVSDREQARAVLVEMVGLARQGG